MKAHDPLALLCIKHCKDKHLRNGQMCLSNNISGKRNHEFSFVSVQLSRSVLSTFLRPHWQTTPGFPVHCPLPELLKLMSIELVISSDYLILCCPLFLLPSIFPSIRVFSNDSVLHIRWPKYWSFSFNISPSNEYSGLISFRIDLLDFLAVQGTLKSLLQYHSSTESVL